MLRKQSPSNITLNSNSFDSLDLPLREVEDEPDEAKE